MTKKYIEELEADIMPVDGLIAFAESEAGAQEFGPEKTKEVAAHARRSRRPARSTATARVRGGGRPFSPRRSRCWAEM